MAKTVLGPAFAQLSGAFGGAVASRNRAGTYLRTRVHPTIVTSDAAMAAKSRLAGVSAAYAGLTTDQKLAWGQFGANNPIMDRVGMKQTLDAHASYVRINGKLLAAGQSALTEPPVGVAPAPFANGSLTARGGTQSLSLAWTDRTLGADEVAVIKACVVGSAGKSYVKNLLRTIYYSDAAESSPLDLLAAFQSRLGDVITGMFIHVEMSVLDKTTGLESMPIAVSTEVTAS